MRPQDNFKFWKPAFRWRSRVPTLWHGDPLSTKNRGPNPVEGLEGKRTLVSAKDWRRDMVNFWRLNPLPLPQ